MLINIERFTDLILLNLLEKKVQFNFVYAIFDYLENPQNQSYLAIAKFYKNNYNLMAEEIETVSTIAENVAQTRPNYKQLFFGILTNALCEYRYTFTDVNGIKVQSNLLFAIIKNAKDDCIKGMIDYLNQKHLNNVLNCPQIFSSSYVYSTIMHEFLKQGKDELALKCAMNMENKSILFLQDSEGSTALEIATEKTCLLSLSYLVKIKQIGEAVGILKN